MKRNGKKKTFNVQRSTFNIQWEGRVAEETGVYGGAAAGKDPTKFDLEDRLLEFTARLIKLVDALPACSRASAHIAAQLLRCGTSPFAHHGEVQAAKSRRDFVHKLSVCRKELKETRRWLRLIGKVGLIAAKRVQLLLLETEELIRIFSASIRTAQGNAK